MGDELAFEASGVVEVEVLQALAAGKSGGPDSAFAAVAVAGGDLTKRITVDVRGEMLDLKETVNGMTESLSLFADEVTRVAKEVGTEGLLGGQAQVTNVGGTWKDLTDNVNVMAANVSYGLVGVSVGWCLTDTSCAVDVTSPDHCFGYGKRAAVF